MRCFPFFVYSCVCLEMAQGEVVVRVSVLGSILLCYFCSNLVQLRGVSGSIPIFFAGLLVCLFVYKKLCKPVWKEVIHQALEDGV